MENRIEHKIKTENKWTDYPLETTEELTVLAKEVASFMEADETEPTAEDRDKWLSDAKLRELEFKIIQTESKFDKYTQLCEQASREVQNPHAQVLLILGALNGERRKPIDHNNQTVKNYFNLADNLITALPEGNRKTRLDSLLEYHKSVWSSAVGDYRMAAELQRNSMEKAEKIGDIKGFAISAFCENVELASAAIADGNETVIGFRLKMLETAWEFMKNTLDDKNPDTAHWLKFNGPGHLIISSFWGNTDLANKNNLLIELREYVDRSKNSTHQPFVNVCRAIVENDLTLAQDVWDGKVHGELYPEYKATAGLILARTAREQNINTAVSQYKAIIEMDAPIHVVRSIAQRELSELNQPLE